MKDKRISWPMVIGFGLAMVLIGVGIVFGVETFSHFEQLAFTHGSDEELLQSIRVTAVYAIVFSSMVVSGIAILILLYLRLVRNTVRLHRETEALRKKNEAMAELTEKTRQLAHHQRLETIGTLTSSIAHEFNNLLTPIMGYSLMALEKLPPEDELYDDILEIYNASRQAKTIISRLSDLSRRNTDTTFRMVSPDELVRKTLDVARPAKTAQVEVKLNLNCQDQRIRANEIQLSQLLLNLILNGFYAMESGPGVLTVDTSFDEEFIHIRVADTGCGIPESIRSRIFEPFFTTKDTGRGTGLGLAIAMQVVEDHQGRIDVQSREGEGSAFTVSLPRNAEEKPAL